MASVINHRLKDRYISPFKRQTIELRSADGSAFVHLLLAGMTMAIEYGLDHGNVSLKLADKRHIQEGDEVSSEIPELPPTCYQSAQYLREESDLYTRLIPKYILDHVASRLEEEGDENLVEALSGLDETAAKEKIQEIMHRSIHVG